MWKFLKFKMLWKQMGDMEDRGVEDLASAEILGVEAQATGREEDVGPATAATVPVITAARREAMVVVVAAVAGQEDADLATDLAEAVGLTAGAAAMHQEDVGLAVTDQMVADLVVTVVTGRVVTGRVVADRVAAAVTDLAVVDPAVVGPTVVDLAVLDLVVVDPAVVDPVVVGLVVAVGLVVTVGLVDTVGGVVVDLVAMGQVGMGRREVLTSLLQAVLLMLAHPLEDIRTMVTKVPHALVVEASVEALAEVPVGCLVDLVDLADLADPVDPVDLVASEVEAEWAAMARRAQAQAEQGLEASGRLEEAICQ